MKESEKQLNTFEISKKIYKEEKNNCFYILNCIIC
jgi:hypothetical protein